MFSTFVVHIKYEMSNKLTRLYMLFKEHILIEQTVKKIFHYQESKSLT